MHIRLANMADVAALTELGAATFAGTFQSIYTAVDLADFLNEWHSEDYYQAALKDPKVRIWVIEGEGGKLIGYCKVGPNTLPCNPPGVGALELSRLYLRNDYQGMGLGAALTDTVIAYARSEAYAAVTVGVFSENIGAQRFYKRYGFTKIVEYNFQVGQQLDHEFILLKTL